MPIGVAMRSSFRGQHFLLDTFSYLFKARGKYSPCSRTNTAKIVSALSLPEYFITGGFWCVLTNTDLAFLWIVMPVWFAQISLCYRSCYVLYYHRYKSLCPDTWPNWDGRLIDGVSTLARHLGYKPEEYKLGRFVVPQRNLSQMFSHLFVQSLKMSLHISTLGPKSSSVFQRPCLQLKML